MVGTFERFILRMETLRSDDRRRRLAFVGAIVIGLGLAWIHRTGLVIAGTCLGVTGQRLLTALLAGLGFGVIPVGLTVILVPAVPIGALTTLMPMNYATLLSGLFFPAWGSLARYVI